MFDIEFNPGFIFVTSVTLFFCGFAHSRGDRHTVRASLLLGRNCEISCFGDEFIYLVSLLVIVLFFKEADCSVVWM